MVQATARSDSDVAVLRTGKEMECRGMGQMGRKRRRRKGERGLQPDSSFSSFVSFLFSTEFSEKRESKKNKIKKIKEYFYQVRNYLPHEYLVVKTKVGLVLFLIKLIWFQN